MVDKISVPQAGVPEDVMLAASEKIRDVKVRLMQYGDVPRARETLEEAFANDPFHDYLNHTPDAPPSTVSRFSRNVDSTIMWTDFTFSRQAWTVDHGDAVVGYLPAQSTQGILTKILGFIIGTVIEFKNVFTKSKEQKKRLKELREKINKATDEMLGDDVNEVIVLQILATAPAKQGRGYASALVKQILEIAAKEGRITALTSSNTKNNGFYESLGFVARKTVIAGDDNPTWDKAPVVLTLMTHEPTYKAVDSQLAGPNPVKVED